MMHERGKSDSPVVPAKPPNKAGRPVAEVVEERGLAEGNTDDLTRPGRSAGSGVSSELGRVREVAVRDKEGDKAAVAVGTLLDSLLIGGQVGAELVVDDDVMLVDAALHLGLAAAGEHGECGCGKEWCGDLGGALHL